MQKIWILSELFYPDETSTSFILTKIANKLAEQFEIGVITMGKHQKIDSSYFTLNSEIDVLRFQKLSDNKKNLFVRLISFFYSSFIITYNFARRVKKNDKVLIVTNPAPLILLVSLLKKIKKFQLHVLVHDVFPENTVPAGIIKDKTEAKYKIIKKIFNWAYLNVDKIIVLGRDMEEIFLKKSSKLKNKIRIIENWGDIETIFPENKNENINEIVIQYAGNVGRVQGLQELLTILKDADNPLIRFDIYGEGVLKPKLQKWVAENKMQNVYFYPAYERNKQNEILNSCHLAIVSLAEGMFGLGVPSKTYNILASGKPILYFGEKNTEVDLLINENKIGYSFQQNEKNKIEQFFKNLDLQIVDELKKKGENARILAEKRYSEEHILGKFVNLFNED